jgi:dTDP-4-dehydrorhamnose reductase
MKILVTGAGGMLSHALVPILHTSGHDVVAVGRAELDVTERDAVERRVQAERPDAVVQCAAYTAVDRAEREEELAFMVNAEATGYVADACQRIGAMLVYPSTDYVFAGTGDRPYRPEDATGPINAYGRSKLAGERAASRCDRSLVVRTSLLYGAGGSNFVDTIRRLAAERESLDVVDDQTGRPTTTAEFSRTVARLLELGAAGTFHATGGGPATTWYGLAREIVGRMGGSTEVRPVPSSRFPRPAQRPAYSMLECSATERVTGREFRDWRDSLSAYLTESHAVDAQAVECSTGIPRPR